MSKKIVRPFFFFVFGFVLFYFIFFSQAFFCCNFFETFIDRETSVWVQCKMKN